MIEKLKPSRDVHILMISLGTLRKLRSNRIARNLFHLLMLTTAFSALAMTNTVLIWVVLAGGEANCTLIFKPYGEGPFEIVLATIAMIYMARQIKRSMEIL